MASGYAPSMGMTEILALSALLNWGMQKPMGENLKLVYAEFSTIS
jgi:hypothetical protein